MHKSFYPGAYNTAVLLLNQPFTDMRQAPEKTIVKAVENVRAAMSMKGQRMTEAECDTMLRELLEAQTAAKTTGSGRFAKEAWQWPKKSESEGTYLSHHTVTD